MLEQLLELEPLGLVNSLDPPPPKLEGLLGLGLGILGLGLILEPIKLEDDHLYNKNEIK